MKKGYQNINYFRKPINYEGFMIFPQSSQVAVENSKRILLLNFNIFIKKRNFNTLFIDC